MKGKKNNWRKIEEFKKENESKRERKKGTIVGHIMNICDATDPFFQVVMLCLQKFSFNGSGSLKKTIYLAT